MNTAILSRTAIFLIFAFALFGPAVMANAEERGTNFDSRLEMAYAPQEENNLEDRFEQFNLHGDYEDAHELNDAWLGMPVRDAAGKVVGYVEDAFLDEEGYLTELLVSLNGSSVMVTINEANVQYSEVGVLVDMPVQAIAKLESIQVE